MPPATWRNLRVPPKVRATEGEPAHVALVLDTSLSTTDLFGMNAPGSPPKKKAAKLANTIASKIIEGANAVTTELLRACSPDGQTVEARVHLSVTGFGDKVRSLLPGGKDLVPITEVASWKPIRFDEHTTTGQGGSRAKIRRPVFFDWQPNGASPALAAVNKALEVQAKFHEAFEKRADEFVTMLTDAQFNCGDPRPAAEKLKAAGAKFFIVQITGANGGKTVAFPKSPEEIRDEFGRMACEMTSLIDEDIAKAARQMGYNANAGDHGFLMNAPAEQIVRLLMLFSSNALASQLR